MTSEVTKAFEDLKRKIADITSIVQSDKSKEFILTTDASDTVMKGEIPSQLD